MVRVVTFLCKFSGVKHLDSASWTPSGILRPREVLLLLAERDVFLVVDICDIHGCCRTSYPLFG